MPLSYFEKNCLKCGVKFFKQYTWSKKYWETSRRFCSALCGNAYSAEGKIERLKKYRFKKGNKPIALGNRGKKGKENGYWKENPSYNTLHRWLIDNYKKTGKCFNCEREGKTHWARVSKTYTRNIEDYRELCPKCHIHYDRYGMDINI